MPFSVCFPSLHFAFCVQGHLFIACTSGPVCCDPCLYRSGAQAQACSCVVLQGLLFLTTGRVSWCQPLSLTASGTLHGDAFSSFSVSSIFCCLRHSFISSSWGESDFWCIHWRSQRAGLLVQPSIHCEEWIQRLSWKKISWYVQLNVLNNLQHSPFSMSPDIFPVIINIWTCDWQQFLTILVCPLRLIVKQLMSLNVHS